LPQELRHRNITTMEAANEFLREHYIAEFNQKFARPAAEAGTAFIALTGQDLEWIFTIQQERKVRPDNTVQYQNRMLQIEPVSWRATLAGCHVLLLEHLDGTLSLHYGPQCVGRYGAEGGVLKAKIKRGARLPVEKTLGGKVKNRPFPPCNESDNRYCQSGQRVEPPSCRTCHNPPSCDRLARIGRSANSGCSQKRNYYGK
jgi:hypothetical protein